MSDILTRPEIVWFIIGLVLFCLELVIPGFVIFFFGLGAWVSALVCLAWSPGTNLQIIIFAVVSLLSLAALRRIMKKKFFYSHGKESDDVEDEFTGKEAIAATDFAKDNTGKVDFKGTRWDAESSTHIKEGQRVIIIKKDSFKLLVEPNNL